MKITGIVLIVVGALILAYQGFTYNSTQQDAKIGDLTIQHTEQKSVYLPPVLGGVLVAAGVVSLIVGSRRAIL